MQQTEKRGFNIIETSDPFSPDALNDNTRKLEAALDAHEEAVDGRLAAVVSRVVELEKLRFTYGAYDGDGIEGSVRQIGFTPAALFLWAHTPKRLLMLINGMEYLPGHAEIVPGGFKLTGIDANSHNARNYHYSYAAFGLDE